jgi:hypothetical protein
MDGSTKTVSNEIMTLLKEAEESLTRAIFAISELPELLVSEPPKESPQGH